MMKKCLRLVLMLMLILALSSCNNKKLFETQYYKTDGVVGLHNLPDTSIVIGSLEADFDNDGNNERLDIKLCGSDDPNATTRPIVFEMYKKDYDGEMSLASLTYPNDVNYPVMYDGFLSKDRVDVFTEQNEAGVKIYFEESGISNHFADFKSFYLVGYEFKNYDFNKIADPVTYIGSYPELYEVDNLIKSYEDSNSEKSIEESDYTFLKNFKEKVESYNINVNRYGYDYPICDNDKKFTKVVRLIREESNVNGATEWHQSDDIGPFGKVSFFTK